MNDFLCCLERCQPTPPLSGRKFGPREWNTTSGGNSGRAAAAAETFQVALTVQRCYETLNTTVENPLIEFKSRDGNYSCLVFHELSVS